jgi:hypothetical protein
MTNSNTLTSLSCSVRVAKSGVESDLGVFKMVEDKTVTIGKPSQIFCFDYQALAEELVNRQFMDDETEASLACETIEYSLNEGGEWTGEFESESGIKVSFVIEPDAVKTEDGFTFQRQPDGSYSDGDMSWPTFEEFKETCEVEWKPAPAKQGRA